MPKLSDAAQRVHALLSALASANANARANANANASASTGANANPNTNANELARASTSTSTSTSTSADASTTANANANAGANTNTLSASDVAAVHALLKEHRAALELIAFQEQHIANLAMCDELTGLKNRRGFMVLGEQQVRLADRTHRPLVLFFADVDGLKRINDTLGHAAGDEAIRCAARALELSFRTTDVVARLAGDELVVLAPECRAEAAPMVVERVHATLASMPNKPCPKLRMSVGYVVHNPSEEMLSLDELLALADAEMYAKKRARKQQALAAATAA